MHDGLWNFSEAWRISLRTSLRRSLRYLDLKGAQFSGVSNLLSEGFAIRSKQVRMLFGMQGSVSGYTSSPRSVWWYLKLEMGITHKLKCTSMWLLNPKVREDPGGKYDKKGYVAVQKSGEWIQDGAPQLCVSWFINHCEPNYFVISTS